jgi:hypothetical protein
MLYVLKGEKIKGNFTFNSPKFNTNEWMSESTTPEQQNTETTALEPVEIPENIDFVMTSSIQELIYDTYNLKNFKGKVIIKDKILTVENADFDLLGGRFKSSFTYNTQNIKNPEVKMNMTFQEFKIPEAYKTFSMISTYVPIAEKLEGLMNASFNYQSFLKQDMMPDLATINCAGVAELLDVSAKNLDFLNKLNEVTKLKTDNQITLKNQKVKFKIENGRLKVEPFDAKWGDNQMNVSGSNGLDQSLDYLLKMTIPTGKVGETVVQHLNQLTNKSLSTPQNLKVDLKVTGTLSNPVITPIGASTDNNLKQQLKEEAKQKVEELKKQTEDLISKQKEEKSENVIGDKVLFLRLVKYEDDGHYTNELWVLDSTNEQTLYKSPYTNICGKEFHIIREGVVVIGFDGSRPVERIHRLVLLDSENLSQVKVTKEEIFWRSHIVYNEGKIYAFEKYKNDVYLSRFNPDLTLDARSSEPVGTNSELSFYKDRIFLTGKPGNEEETVIRILQRSDLKVLKTLKPIENRRKAK